MQGLIVAPLMSLTMRNFTGVILFLSAASSARGQTAPLWTIQLTHREERLDGERLRGATDFSALRRVGRGAVGADIRWIDEPSRNTIGVGAELYTPLWHFSEGRLRVFSAPRAWSAPDLLVAAELTQHLRGGWHVSVSADDRKYDQGRVQAVAAGAGWSGERWFVRARGGGLRTEIKTLATGDIMVRRASPDRRSHVQISASTGGDVFDFADPVAGTPLITGQSTTAALSVLYPATPSLGVIAGLGVGDYGRFGTRAHFEAGITIFAGLHE
jgi:YaiO family outer membrane protein